MSTAQEIAEEVESVVEGLAVEDAPARRVRRRPLALQPKPGELTWACGCEGCRDLVAAQIAKLTDGPTIERATPEDDEPLPESWLAI